MKPSEMESFVEHVRSVVAEEYSQSWNKDTVKDLISIIDYYKGLNKGLIKLIDQEWVMVDATL